MQQLKTTLTYVWNWLTKTLSQILNWLMKWIGRGIYFISTKIAGQQRIDNLIARYRHYRAKASQKFHQYVDVNTPYYKKISMAWKLFFGILGLAIFYIFAIETNFLWLFGKMPSVEDLKNPKVAQASEIYSADGKLIGKLYTENRTRVDFDSISPHLINALIATEDVRFYKHAGIDPRAMFGVAFGILQGGDRGGGSTVTQQLAKKLFRTRRRAARGLLGDVPLLRTIIYKTKEWLTAIRLERNFSKEEILAMYFNTVDYGSNTYGIKTASHYYFDKSPHELSVQEAAVLVGLQKATTTYNPSLSQKSYERSLERRNTVLDQMVKYNYLKKTIADSVSKLPIELHITPERLEEQESLYSIYQYFNENVEEFVKSWGEETDYDPYTDGLKIHTTIDSRMQKYAVEAVQERMSRLQKSFEDQWQQQNPWRDENGKEIPNFLKDVAKRTDTYKELNRKFSKLDSKIRQDSIWYYMNKKDTMYVYDWRTGKEKKVIMSSMDSLNYYKRILRAGMMAMEPSTGQVKAWVGGLHHKFFKYDAVKKGKRQPGSTFKPFAYCAAIDSSTFNMTPCDRIKDAPFQVEIWEKKNGKNVKTVWKPKNATGGFSYQSYTLRRALARSVNSVTAHLTDKIGAQTVVNYAKKLGISTPLNAVASVGLGPFDVSLYDMVRAYSVFPNQGRRPDPMLVSHIEDVNGKEIESFTPKNKQVISEESAFLMIYMLKGGLEEPGGTSQGMRNFASLFKNKFEMGGKTGTTSNYSDGWYMGVTKDLVVGAWVGGDDRSIHLKGSNGEGARTALPLVGQFLEHVYNDPNVGYARGPFPKPTVQIVKSYKDCAPPVSNRPAQEEDPYRDSLYMLPPSIDPNIEEPEVPTDTTSSN